MKEMNGLTISKLRKILSRDITLNLVDANLSEAYYYGPVRNIPAKYNSWKAVDILGFDGCECMMAIAE